MQRKRLWLVAGILLVVGGALYLLTWLPAQAVIHHDVQTTIEDFNTGEFYHTGLTRKQNTDGEISLLTMGIAGSWAVTDVTGLPPVYGHAMVQHNGYMYVIGGRLANSVLTDSVYFAHINPETYMLEPFTTTTPLPTTTYPQGVYRHTAVVVGNYLYVIGGLISPSTYNAVSDAVIFAQFNSDGTLGDWQTASSLPGPRAFVPAVELNGYIYVIGGSSSSSVGNDTTLYAKPDIYGQISGWATTEILPYAVYGHMVAGYEGRLYMLGGVGNDGFTLPYVYYATPLTATGEIPVGGWIETIVLPSDMYQSVALAFNGELFAIGGILAGGNASAIVRAALIDIQTGAIITEAGIPEGWVDSQSLDPGRYGFGVATDPNNQYVYLLGGTSGGIDPIGTGLLNRGATTGVGGGAGYASHGWYIGPPFDLGRARRILSFSWTAEYPDPGVTMTLEYNMQSRSGGWSGWLKPVSPSAVQAGNLITYTVDFPTEVLAQQFQYRVTLTTSKPLSYTPYLRNVDLEYDVPSPPEFAKIANPPSNSAVQPGQRITYTISVSNPNALSSLHNVKITDTLPITLIYQTGSVTATAGITIDLSNLPELRWELGTLPPHTGGKMGFVAQVRPSAPPGTRLVNRARFMSYDADSIDKTTIHYVLDNVPKVNKQADPPSGSTIEPGATITYTIVYTNADSATSLTNVKVQDTLPPVGGLVPGSCTPGCIVSGKQLTWTVGTLTPGQSGQVRFKMRISSLVVDGAIIENVALLTSDQVSKSSNTTSHLISVPYDLMISKSDGRRTAAAGDTLIYTIAYTNVVPSGLVTPTNVIITDDLLTPGWVTIISGSPGWQVISPTRRVYNAGALGPNESRTLQLTVKVADTLPEDPVLSVRNQVRIGDDGQHGVELDSYNNVNVDSDAVRGPDLLLEAHALGHAYVNMPFKISADVINQGLIAAKAWDDTGADPSKKWIAVELYAKPVGFTPPGAPSGPKDHAGGWCATNVTPCPSADQRYGFLAFIFPPDYPLGAGDTSHVSFAPVWTHIGDVYWLYLQVDVANPSDQDYGRVLEADETNNIVFLGNITVEPVRVYLPIVSKKR